MQIYEHLAAPDRNAPGAAAYPLSSARDVLSLAMTSRHMRSIALDPSPKLAAIYAAFARKISGKAIEDAIRSWRTQTADEIIARHPMVASASAEHCVRHEVLWQLLSDPKHSRLTRGSPELLGLAKARSGLTGEAYETASVDVATRMIERDLKGSKGVPIFPKQFLSDGRTSTLRLPGGKISIDKICSELDITEIHLKRSVLVNGFWKALSSRKTIAKAAAQTRTTDGGITEADKYKAKVMGIGMHLNDGEQAPEDIGGESAATWRHIAQFRAREMVQHALTTAPAPFDFGNPASLDRIAELSRAVRTGHRRHHLVDDDRRAELGVAEIRGVHGLKMTGLAEALLTGQVDPGRIMEAFEPASVEGLADHLLRNKVFDDVASLAKGDVDWTDPQSMGKRVDDAVALLGPALVQRLTAARTSSQPEGQEAAARVVEFKRDLFGKGIAFAQDIHALDAAQATALRAADPWRAAEA